MPSLYQLFGYSVFFWSNEGEPLEPVHFHIGKQRSKHTTKVWILSDYSLLVENNYSDIKQSDLNRLIKILTPLSKKIVHEWEAFFGEKAVFKDS